jgi:N-methylhydantoinase B
VDPIRLQVFKSLLTAIAEEMGAALRKSSYSPNVKERKDYSCAVFNDQGKLISQAAHIPVHLGSMPLSVQAAISMYSSGEKKLSPGDSLILNDPYQGGTHLPDITLVSPVFFEQDKQLILVGYVANRAHHSDIGGMTPGSMPIAREIYQEGLIIPPIKLQERGLIKDDILELILANVRTPNERRGDIYAQIAANYRGQIRLLELVNKYGLNTIEIAMTALIEYSAKITRLQIKTIPDGIYSFEDYLDNDGITSQKIRISVEISIQGDQAEVNFSRSSPECLGSVNAVYAITLSAVYYVFRCLMPTDVPNNAGILEPINVIAPKGLVVNASSPSPVAGGNVETSQRIVDVLLGALAKALPNQIPAASQGTMNNLTIGGKTADGKPFTYYETIAGGAGAGPGINGADGVHTHMTNTLNTPVEALEYAYPLRVTRYEIILGTGGKGFFTGGNGVRRDICLLTPATVTLLTDRRITQPYGLSGGKPGKPGRNIVIHRDGREQNLTGKGSFELQSGDTISIRTPGGGGFGELVVSDIKVG